MCPTVCSCSAWSLRLSYQPVSCHAFVGQGHPPRWPWCIAMQCQVVFIAVHAVGRDITVEYTASGTSWEDRKASQGKGGAPSRNYSPPPRRRSRSPDYGRSRQRSHSRGRRSRQESRSPSPRHLRSSSPARSNGHRHTRRKVSRSPLPRGSPTVSPQRSLSAARSLSPRPTSMSPKPVRSSSPSAVPYQDSTSRAASRSMSQSP